MKCNEIKRIGMTVFGITFFAYLNMPQAHARNLFDEMQVQDTCGTTYADKLSSCTSFNCQKPSFLAAMMGTLPDAIKKMTTEQRAAMKAKMTSTFAIKGFDGQGLCQTQSIISPDNRQDCTYDKSMLKRVSDYEKAIAMADHVESESSGETVNGKWVSKSVTIIDGKKIDNPMVEALNNGICKTLLKDTDLGWVSMNKMNRMSHFEFNLLEHGKHVDGHIQILNSTDGKVLFDKDVGTSYDTRKINLYPGTFDIKVSSKNSQLAPVWFRGIKLGEANVLKKDVEFYAISGTLKLTVNVDGTPRNMAIYITEPETHEWIYPKASMFGNKPKFYFKSASITLPESLTGKYKIFVTPVMKGFKPPKAAKYEQFMLSIHNGEAIKKTINIGPSIVVGKAVTKDAKNITPKAVLKKQFPIADDKGMEQNTDRPEGTLIRHFLPASDNPALCQKACREDGRCKVWTYVKPNTVQGASPNCWLKSDVSRAYPNECCVSGVVKHP